MTAGPDRADIMPLPPDAYVGIALVLAIAGEVLWPLGFLPPAAVLSPLTGVALVVAGLGLALEVSAAQALTMAGTSTRPNGAAGALVTWGVFHRSRNPFYLGLLMIVLGLMLAFSLDWGVVFLPLLWLGLDQLVVPVEERRLERAFGQDFRDYATRVRRWL